ncbi:MAG TPA: class I SAM-dependent methyltransferase [Longimicrobiales bacterium]|nr:class I SAM-dependent methyltransferase [Longimicrobiales bacterium]
MSCACSDFGLDEIFTDRHARRDARNYRKHGLPPRARLLLRLIERQHPIAGATVLEGGAGAGALTVELARRGALSAHGIDATPAAVQIAQQLAADYQVADRTRFVAGDFSNPPHDTPRADLVILDRVVCCFPDWQALLANAAAQAKHVVALVYPVDNLFSRAVARVLNTGQVLLRHKFRLHIHPVADMHAYLQQHGFVGRASGRYWMWEVAVLIRSPPFLTA